MVLWSEKLSTMTWNAKEVVSGWFLLFFGLRCTYVAWCAPRHKCTCTSQRRRRMWLVALHFPAYVCRSFPSKHTDLLACCSRTSTSSSVAFIATQTLTTVPVLIQYEPRYCYYNVFRNTCERLFDGGWYCVFSGQFFFPAVKYLFYYRFTKK